MDAVAAGDKPYTPALRRYIIEQLVDTMLVYTVKDEAIGKLRAEVHVCYRFSAPEAHAETAQSGTRDEYDPAYTMVCKLPRRLIEK